MVSPEPRRVVYDVAGTPNLPAELCMVCPEHPEPPTCLPSCVWCPRNTQLARRVVYGVPGTPPSCVWCPRNTVYGVPGTPGTPMVSPEHHPEPPTCPPSCVWCPRNTVSPEHRNTEHELCMVSPEHPTCPPSCVWCPRNTNLPAELCMVSPEHRRVVYGVPGTPEHPEHHTGTPGTPGTPRNTGELIGWFDSQGLSFSRDGKAIFRARLLTSRLASTQRDQGA
jgi:hypothetical protein